MHARITSTLELKAQTLALIEAGDLDRALRNVHHFVERIITEPLCTAQVFGSELLDELCLKIGGANWGGISATARKGDTSLPNVLYVYIATKLQRSGGHTRVIEDFIRARPGAKHVILATELEGASDKAYLTDSLSQEDDVQFEAAPPGSFQDRLTWLQQRLVVLNPLHVYLFNHHQDSVAVAALHPDLKLDGSFYHHGDHHLCLGVYLRHLRHIDIHPMGYHHCRDALGLENTYIPLTASDKGQRLDGEPVTDGPLITSTAGRSNKIEVPYPVSYVDVIPRLLHVTGGRHVHIGHLTPWARLRIARGLKRLNISEDRFVYVPWVPSVWRAMHEHKVDLYIASFPYGGALTLIEVMGAGVPVVLHRHIFSRILSGIELGYPEAFSWRTPDELLAHCGAATRQRLREEGKIARDHYKRFHQPQALKKLLDGDCAAQPRPLAKDFTVEHDAWAIWAEQRVSLRQVISRDLYRSARTLRARLSKTFQVFGG